MPSTVGSASADETNQEATMYGINPNPPAAQWSDLGETTARSRGDQGAKPAAKWGEKGEKKAALLLNKTSHVAHLTACGY